VRHIRKAIRVQYRTPRYRIGVIADEAFITPGLGELWETFAPTAIVAGRKPSRFILPCAQYCFLPSQFVVISSHRWPSILYALHAWKGGTSHAELFNAKLDKESIWEELVFVAP